MSDNFTIKGSQRSDGFIKFTCDELPGFRLLIKADADKSAYESDIRQALSQFVPLYNNAQIRVLDKLAEPQNLALDWIVDDYAPIKELQQQWLNVIKPSYIKSKGYNNHHRARKYFRKFKAALTLKNGDKMIKSMVLYTKYAALAKEPPKIWPTLPATEHEGKMNFDVTFHYNH